MIKILSKTVTTEVVEGVQITGKLFVQNLGIYMDKTLLETDDLSNPTLDSQIKQALKTLYPNESTAKTGRKFTLIISKE